MGRPRTACMFRINQKIALKIATHVTVRRLLKIGKYTVRDILTIDINKRKVYALFMPRT